MPRALWAKAPLALLRHPAGLLAVVCAAFLVAVGAAAGPLMKAGVESEALRAKLAQLTPLAAGLAIDRPGAPDPGSVAAVAAADRSRRGAAVELGRTLPSVGRPVLTTSTYAVISAPRFQQGNPIPVAPMSRTGATAHVQRLAGSGGGVWLSSAITNRAGGRVRLIPGFPTAASRSITLPVAGVYRRLDDDLSNPYWVNFTARIRAEKGDDSPPPPFAFVTQAQLYRLAQVVSGSQLGNDYEYPIDASSMTPARAKKVARAFQAVGRRLAARSTFAARLGCADAQRPCQVTSALTDAVRIASAGNSSLQPVIDLLAGFCVLIALGAALIAGVFTGRRRAAEARLSLVGGESRPAFLARAAAEALLPAVVGAAAGLLIAVELVRLFTPHGSVDGGVFRQAGLRVVLSVAASVLAVAVGTTLARGRLGTGRAARHAISRVPWEAVVIAAAVVSWVVLASGRGLVEDRVAGSHPRLVVLLLPALVAAPLTGVVGRLLRSVVLRRVVVASTAVFLALRRVAAARGLVIALTVTVAAGIASFAFADILRSSLVTSSTEKAYVANGSDVQGVIDAGRSLPAFPFPVTKTSVVFGAGSLPSGEALEVITVDPPSLGRVLAAHWPADVRSAVRALATSRARLPAIGVGVGTGRQTVTLGESQVDVQVVARVRAFPGMQPSERLLVIPVRALSAPPAQSEAYVWATGPPARVESALAASTLSPMYLTVVADFGRTPEVENITRTYGLLRIVAFGIVLLSLLALMLYLSGRERSQLVTSAFLRRMGMSQLRQASSVALESVVLVGVATVVGLAAALVTARAIVGHVDPLSQYSPPPVVTVPWLLLIGSAVGVIAVAALVGAVLTLVVPRSGVGEQLRVS